MSFLGLKPTGVLGLLLMGGTVVLVLYTVRWRLPQRLVSTIGFWTRSSTGKRGGGRMGALEHILSMLLQLAILTLLVLAAGQPRLACQSPGGRAVVLVLDRSSSMAALEKIESRLDMARRRGYERLEQLSGADRVGVILSGGEPLVAAPVSADPALARRALSAAEIRVGPGRLGDAVSLACRMLTDPAEATIVVLTDGSEAPGSCAHAAVEIIAVGTARPNLGITAFATALRRNDPRYADAFVEVKNASPSLAHTELRVDLDGKLLRVARLEIKPQAVERTVIEGIPLGGPGRLVARLTDIRIGQDQGDPMHLDDSAFAVLPRVGTLPVDLVGRSAPVEMALAANPRLLVRKVAAPRPGALTVIAGAIDAPLPAGAFLLIDPSGSGAPAKVGAPIASPRITYWHSEHPILRGLVLYDVVIGSARSITLPPGATALAGSPETPLLYSLADDERRIVALGFAPESSNLPLRVSFPIFLYNAIDWLAGQGRDDDEWTFPSGVEVATPSGRRLQVAAFEGRARVVPEAPGFYDISVNGSPVRELAASVADAGESAIAPLSQAPSTATAGRFRDRDPSRGFLLLALALLIIEWSTFHRRRTV